MKTTDDFFESRYNAVILSGEQKFAGWVKMIPVHRTAKDMADDKAAGSQYVYTKTKNAQYKYVLHGKKVSPKVALQKFNDWLKLDDD